jgi:predicted GNAT family acetyltransferase
VGGGRARRAEAADLPLVLEWSATFGREIRTSTPPDSSTVEARLMSGCFWLWETTQPVAMAAVPRRTPHGAAVAYVYTPAPLRGRGYASAVTAALTQSELAAGNLCFLYTNLSNPTSNKIYQALGYQPVCDVDEWRFASPPLAP